MTPQEKAKAMVCARDELAQVLMNCATALAQASEVLANSCLALQQAAEKEQAATMDYISSLEAALSQQCQLS
jgi:hypothetical protein